MKLGIMQPYFLPYVGYFQLINAVDLFVIYDDVQWMKGGWINRNRILAQGNPRYITLPVQRDSVHLNINQRFLSMDYDDQKKKILRQVECAYRTAPQFHAIMEMLSEILMCAERNVSAFVVNSLHVCCAYLGISTPMVMSSELSVGKKLDGQDRVLEINAMLGSTHYINPIGGAELYSKEQFKARGHELGFIKPRSITYNQNQGATFVPFLSIIDVMMFNDRAECTRILEEYDLV